MATKGSLTGRPRMVYGYCRVSHQDSAESGYGIAHQVAAFEAYIEFREKTNPFPTGTIRGISGWEGGWMSKATDGRKILTRTGRGRADGMFVDLAVSAYRKPLRVRPAGAYLDTALRSGDIVVFPKLDRAFRSLRDFANTLPEWEDRGVTVVFLNPSFDMSEPSGRFCGHLFAAFAEFESGMKSERTKDALAQAWLKGQPSNTKKLRVFGWRRSSPSKPWEPYWSERRVLRDVVIHGAETGECWADIRTMMEKEMAALECRKTLPNRRDTPQFSPKHPRPVSEYTEQNLKSWYERYLKNKKHFPLSPGEQT